MKKLLLSIVLSAACTMPGWADTQSDDGKNVSVTGTEVVRIDGNTVSVVFQLHVGTEVTEKNRSLILRPTIKGIDQQSELPPIIIRGEKAKTVAENRAMSIAGVDSEGRYVTANGAVLDYYASIPWQSWMRGSQLMFTGLNVGKGRPHEVNVGTVADNLLTGQSDSAFASSSFDPATFGVQGEQAAQGTVGSPTVTTGVSRRSTNTIGDELASKFSFVELYEKYTQAKNASKFDEVFKDDMVILLGTATPKPENEVDKFVEMTREGALYIQFERGSTLPSRAYGQNNTMMKELVSSVRVLDASPQNRIAKVIIVGFSTPESSGDEKETLGQERAAVVRDLLTANSSIDPTVIDIYNGAVDWVTLRALVAESNMPDKYSVLEKIDNTQEWGGTRDKDRLAYLQELNNGDAYLYMREHFFPQLRQTGAYVKVYYENVL